MVMVKRNVVLYVTHETIEELKARGINISRQVDEYLAQRVKMLRDAERRQRGQGKSRRSEPKKAPPEPGAQE